MRNDCVINGVTYHPEVQGIPTCDFAWDHGPVIFIIRLTQFPNIFYLRIVKFRWRLPPIQSISVWENPDAVKK